jgi:hypothetical protein
MKRGFNNFNIVVLLAGLFTTHFLSAGGGERGDEQDLKKKDPAPVVKKEEPKKEETKKLVKKDPEPEVIVEDVKEDEVPDLIPLKKKKKQVHNHGHLEFMFNYQLGPQMGCFTGNACQSFIPVNRMCGGGMMIQGMAQSCVPQYRPVPVQTVYVSEMPSRFMAGGMMPGMGMNAGMGGCGMGCSPTQPMMVINATPQPVWATANFMPRWNSFEATMRPVFPPQPQAVFNVPQQHTLNPRDIQEIYRQ